MRFSSTFLPGILPLVLLAAACSKFTEDQDCVATGHVENGIITVNMTAKSSTPSIKACILFALDENGKVVHKDSIPCSDDIEPTKKEWTLRTGTYRIWGVANGGAEASKKLWNCGTAADIATLAFPLDGQERGYALSHLTVNGSDDSFTLNSGDTRDITLTGKPLMAKIRLRNIVNKTSYFTLPAYGPVNIRCLEALLLNVADSAAIDESRTFNLRNSTGNRTLDLLNGCTCIAGSSVWIPPEGTLNENLVLYCFPNTAYDGDLILAVAIDLGGECIRWYNIPIGQVDGGCEYILDNLMIMKEGATTPFTLTPTSCFSAQTSASPWEEAAEEGLESSPGEGDMDYSLSHRQVFRENPPENWACEFGEIYGPACVISNNPGKVQVTGAGKRWLLHALADGHASLNLDDGLNALTVPICVGHSIAYSWRNYLGRTWSASKTLYTYQRCSLRVDSSYGTLEADLSGSAFSNYGSSFDGRLVYMYPAREGSLILKDYFENRTVTFPYTLSDWDISDCPIKISGTEGTVGAISPLSATITFPFYLAESSTAVKMRVLDPYGNMTKYDISITGTAGTDSYTVTAKTTYLLGNVSGLGISVYCSLGNKSGRILRIDNLQSVTL